MKIWDGQNQNLISKYFLILKEKVKKGDKKIYEICHPPLTGLTHF